jgi:putative oxidoreductase
LTPPFIFSKVEAHDSARAGACKPQEESFKERALYEQKIMSPSASYLSYTDRLASAWYDFLLLLGRIFLGWIFVESGWNKLWTISTFAAGMSNRSVPAFLGYFAPFVEFFGGLALILGLATRYSALLVILFTLAATWIAHRYWTMPESQKSQNTVQFWKNVSILGGLLTVFAVGGGRLSVDRFLRPGTT